MDGRLSVRCGKQTPTPYLKKWHKALIDPRLKSDEITVVDLGCGDGRNSKFLLDKLTKPLLYAFDIRDDYGTKCVLGRDKLPVRDGSVNIILVNYVFMFLSPLELIQVLEEIDRIASRQCRMMIELYSASASYAQDTETLAALKVTILQHFTADGNWAVFHNSKDRFILMHL